MIDMASVYAERFKQNPQMLQAAVMGQSPDPKLDPYTALNALRLIKEANMMAMAGKAQQPTSSPSIVAETMAPVVPQGLGAMVPGAMGQAPRPPQPPQPQVRPAQPSGGLAAMPTPEREFAAGGIVAFQKGGLGSDATDSDDADRTRADEVALNNLIYNGAEPYGNLPSLREGPTFDGSAGDPTTYATLGAMLPGALTNVQNFAAKTLTPAERSKIETDEIANLKAALGPNTAMESLAADIEARKKERPGALKEGQGVALLKAAAAMAQGNNWVRAFGNAGAAFGDEYNRALQADKAERRSIAVAEFSMADAKRKENMGLYKEGRAAGDRAVAAQQAAEKARFDKTKAVADALVKGMAVTKPYRPPTTTHPPQPKEWQDAVAAYLPEVKAKFPDLPPDQQRARAFQLYQERKGPGLAGVVARTEATSLDKAKIETNNRVSGDPIYLAAQRKKDTAGMAKRRQEILLEELAKPPASADDDPLGIRK